MAAGFLYQVSHTVPFIIASVLLVTATVIAIGLPQKKVTASIDST
jgi:hypothetical protein